MITNRISRCSFLAAFITTFVALPIPGAQASTSMVIEGRQEVLYLDGIGNPARWAPAECTVTSAPPSRRAGGRPTLHMHIPVDYHAGEKKYPIGWPRMYCTLVRPDETRWTEYDRFEFLVYAEMNRPKPPSRPLTFQMHCPDRRTGYTRELSEIRLGQWVRISIPTADKPNLARITRLGFNISESNYRDGDVLDFYIGGFRLVRSTECRITGMQILTPAVFRGAPVVAVQVDVEGPPARLHRGVPFTIRRGSTLIRKETLPVHRGRNRLNIEIDELDLPPGEYTLTAFEGDSERQRRVSFKIAPSPWERKP